jgi:hypothetical protein
MHAGPLVRFAAAAAFAGGVAVGCPRGAANDLPSIPCPGPATIVVENGTAETYEVWWYEQLLGAARPGTTRIAAPASFPCNTSHDCRGPEFRDRTGRPPPGGVFRGSVEYRVECH